MMKQAGAEDTVSFVKEAFRIVVKYFKARLLISLIIGAACYAVMLVLGLSWKIPVSIVAGLFNLVPYIGPVVAMIVTAVVVVFQNPMDVVWMTITLFGLQILDAVVLSTLILGKSLRVHPLVVFVAVFVGGSMFGIPGVIIAAPAAAIAALLVRRLYKGRKSQQGKHSKEISS